MSATIPAQPGELTRSQPAQGLGAPETPHSFRHEAFLWRGIEEFLAGTTAFIREGLEVGEPVMVAVILPRIDLLRSALGADAALVHFVDMAEFGHNPALIISGWREFVDQQSVLGRAVRGIGEPIWSGRSEEEVAECQLHEGLLNVAMGPETPLWLMCPYDVLSLGAEVIIEAERSHPVLVEAEQRRGSARYGGRHHVESMFEAELPPVAVFAWYRGFGADDLMAVRMDVNTHALTAGLSGARSAELALAVHEVASNSVEHGRGEKTLLIWLEEGALVCEIRDHGRITDPMTGRRTPEADDENGRGLWIANQLCDLVQVRSAADGTTIRMRARI